MLSKLQNLDEIFNAIILRIPDYQRGYSWEKEQLEALWTDLGNIRTDSFHFTGILTLDGIKDANRFRWTKEFEISKDSNLVFSLNKHYEPYFIVDGQQRLVSIFIMISLLKGSIERFSQEEKDEISNKFISLKSEKQIYYLFGYEKDTPSHQYLIGEIFDDPDMVVTEPETVYTKNLYEAKSFFKDKLDGISEEDKINLLYKLRYNLLFNVFEIESNKLDISLVFETLNYRGKKLSKLELFKNRLIFLISKARYQSEEEIRNKIVQTWQTIYEWLGKDPDNRLNDDDFLRSFWIMFYDHSKRNDDDFKEFENDIFNVKYRITDISKNSFLKESRVLELIETLSSSVKYWYFIHNPQTKESCFEFSLSIRRVVDKIKRNKYGAFMRPLILAAFQRGVSQNEMSNLLSRVERHNFCVYLLFGKQADANRPTFWRLANRYFRSDASYGEIMNTIEGKTKEHMSYENIFNHIHSNRQSNYRFLDWNGCKYFFWEWEEFLRDENERLIKEYTKAELDCIFPRVRKDQMHNSFIQVRRSRDYENTEKFTYSLGNITLTKLNLTIYDYYKMRTKLYTGGYDNQKIARDYEEWTDQSILTRGLELLNFLENHWEVSIGDDNQKKRLLLDGAQV